MHIKEDYEVHQTEVPQIHESEEEEKVPTLEEMKTQPIAKKIKKILYSDKSESSIDENMEDTPSNYNIPNGRLDGRSLGLKAVLLKDKRKNKEPARSNPLGEVANSKSGKTLQPISSGGLNKTLGAPNGGTNLLSGQKNGSKQYLSPTKNNAFANERSTGKVNNLFQEDLPVGERNNKQGKIAQQLSSSVEDPNRNARMNQEEEDNMRKTAKALKKQFKNDDAAGTGSGSGGEGGPVQVLNSGRAVLDGGPNPYMIKTAVPQVSNKPPKLSVKRQ